MTKKYVRNPTGQSNGGEFTFDPVADKPPQHSSVDAIVETVVIDRETMCEMSEMIGRLDGEMVNRFANAGHGLFVVGGAVRDIFLGKSSPDADLDLTTDARPEIIKELLADITDDMWFTGEQFGTINCVIDGQSYEITTYRKETYQPHSRKPVVVFGDNIDDDLARRDFTVNAMAIDTVTHTVRDPFGGRADLDASVLQTPLDPVVSLSDDPLRMLRAARFCSKYRFAAAFPLVEAMTTEANRLEIVSSERVRDELTKLLLLDEPTDGFRLLDETGVGRYIPALENVEHLAPYAERVRDMPKDMSMRWAALFTAVKPDDRKLLDLKFSNNEVRTIEWLLTDGAEIANAKDPELSDRRLRELARRCPPEGIVENLLVFAAGLRTADGESTDNITKTARRLAALRKREPDFDSPVPFFGGLQVADILGIKPGPILGEAMNFLTELRTTEGNIGRKEAQQRLQSWWNDKHGNGQQTDSGA